MSDASALAPTPRLRFVVRPGARGVSQRILQQYFDVDVPQYMRQHDTGEWRDVETHEELAP